MGMELLRFVKAAKTSETSASHLAHSSMAGWLWELGEPGAGELGEPEIAAGAAASSKETE